MLFRTALSLDPEAECILQGGGLVIRQGRLRAVGDLDSLIAVPGALAPVATHPVIRQLATSGLEANLEVALERMLAGTLTEGAVIFHAERGRRAEEPVQAGLDDHAVAVDRNARDGEG